jgi:glutamate-1-semialdehyde 2,1-aminomutase
MIAEEIASRFASSHAGSRAFHERARKVIAGGLGHDVRYAAPFPLYIARAQGAYKWDVDGNRYIDYNLGNGALLLGHAHPAVVAAVQAQAPRGTHFGSDHPLQVEWAEWIQRLVPSAERVRFVSSGTEANLLAARLARAATGRTKILRLEGHFHGWHDDLIRGFLVPFDRPASIGVPPNVLTNTVLAPADLDAIDRILARDREIAAVILEPSGASWATVPLPPDFLPGLRDLTRARGVLLIFDEVITGFRWAPGGAQERYGVLPDLTSLAKVVAGGLPGAAVVGRADVLERLAFSGDPARDRHQRVLHYGTFNATPLSAAAAIATLELIATGEPTRKADAVAAALVAGLEEVLERRGIAGFAYGEASAWHVYLEQHPGSGARDRAAVRTSDPAKLKGMPGPLVHAVQTALRQRGVDVMSGIGGLTSAEHTLRDVAETVAAFDDALAELAGHVVARLA